MCPSFLNPTARFLPNGGLRTFALLVGEHVFESTETAMLGKKEVVTSLKGVSLQGWVVQKSGNANPGLNLN